MKSLIRSILALALASCAAHAQLASLQIDAVSPPGAQVGTTVQVSLSGQDLDELTSLTFSHDGITAKHLEGNRFEVTVAPEVPADFYELRVAGRFGLSNARPFEVSRLAQVAETGDHQAANTAMPLAFNTYVDGTAAAEVVDYYKFTAKKGQRLLVECVADRLDSKMDATVVVASSEALELARDRDSYGHDPFIDFTAPADGDYVVGVHDFQFKGSASHYYRLLLNTGAHVDYVFPPSGTPGKRQRFTVYGRNLPGGVPTPVPAGGKPSSGQLERIEVEIDVPEQPDRLLSRALAAIDARGTALRIEQAHRPAPVALAEAPVIPEREPNNGTTNAHYVSVPCEIGGQFYPAEDNDWYEFAARKDQTYWIEVFCDRLGDATDPFLVVEKVTRDGEGNERTNPVTEGDDINENVGGHIFPMTTRDSRVSFKADADARYRVLVRDQFTGASPRNTYRLVIREPRPDFNLLVGTQQYTDEGDQLSRSTPFLRKQGSRRMKVMAQRRDGFNAPIEVTVANLPKGVTAQPCTLGAGQKETTLTLSAGADAEEFAGAIEVKGEADVNGEKIARSAVAADVLWGVGNHKQEYTTARLTPRVPLAVSAVEPAPVVLKPAEDKIYEASLAGKLEIPLQVIKRDNLKDKATIQPVDLPGLKKPKNAQIDNNAKETKLVFEFTKKDGNDFKPGEYTIFAQTKGRVQYRANPEAQTRAEAAKKEKDELVAKIDGERKAADEKQKAFTAELAELNKKVAEQALTKEEGAKLVAEKERAAADAAVLRDAKAKELEAAKQAQAAADADLKKASERAKPQEKKFHTLSEPIRIRIAPAPVKLPEMPQQAVKPESQVEVPVKVERLFGFNDEVQVSVSVPDTAKGVEAQPVSIPKDASETKLVLKAAKDAPPGEKEIRIDAKMKLNGEELVVSKTLKIRVEG